MKSKILQKLHPDNFWARLYPPGFKYKQFGPARFTEIARHILLSDYGAGWDTTIDKRLGTEFGCSARSIRQIRLNDCDFDSYRDGIRHWVIDLLAGFKV